MPLFLGGNADPGIAHLESQQNRRGIGVGGIDTDAHFALFCELDRVANQIGQDLPQARRIADQRRRQTGRDQASELQSFSRGRIAEALGHVLDEVAEIERRLLELDLAGFDFRDIEDSVDDSEQCLGGAAGGFEIMLLLRPRFDVPYQLQHAEDAVHRRAQLMRHVGEKFGLGVVGGLGLQHAMMRLLAGGNQRETGAAPIQHGAELLTILGQQRVTPVSSALDHRASLNRLGAGQCRANCKIKVSNRPKRPGSAALRGCIRACKGMYRLDRSL